MTASQLSQKFPDLSFKVGKNFMYSPKHKVVYYHPDRIKTNHGILALLHEVGHALLGHQTYELDIELLDMEVAAWEKAKYLAKEYRLEIDEKHINDCLETYRIWLYKRSSCPICSNTSLQSSANEYQCFLCDARWQVAQTRTTQPRRMNCTTLESS